MDFVRQYNGYKTRIEAAIDALLPSADTAPETLHAAMRYCMEAGGKRLRPVLVMACADAYPVFCDPAPAAVAIEVLHTYTLIHDDLPCMDDSPLRRGRPSAHIAFGEAAAVLSGDALLTEAFALLGRSYSDHPAIGLRLVQLLGEAADSRHLIAGQVVDTLSEATVINAATLEFIHQHKTADLIRAACLMGLSLSDHPPEAIAICDRMGAHLGLAFQIIDDLLDATADESTMGKSVGTDARNHKNTYVSLHGLEACREAASHHSAAAREAAQSLPAPAAGFLSALIDNMEFRAS